MKTTMLRWIDSPFGWAVVGFAIGLALGVNTASAILVAIGLGAFAAYLWWHGPARPETEGWLFAGGPAFLTAWTMGFVVRGLAFS